MSLKNVFILFCLIIIGSTITAQDNRTSDVNGFIIIIENTESGITLESLDGSAWKKLSIKNFSGNEITINEFGMTNRDVESSNSDSQLADYLFTITKTENLIKLKGIKGTWWTELSFTLDLNSKQTINENGMKCQSPN